MVAAFYSPKIDRESKVWRPVEPKFPRMETKIATQHTPLWNAINLPSTVLNIRVEYLGYLNLPDQRGTMNIHRPL